MSKRYFKRRVKADINIIPFLDILIILLLIFLLSAGYSYFAFNIHLPSSNGKIDYIKKKQEVEIIIDKDGSIFAENKRLSRADFGIFIKNLTKAKNTVFVVKADKNTKYGNIIWIINMIQKFGYSRVSLLSINGDT